MIKKTFHSVSLSLLITYHGHGEGVDCSHIHEAVLPGDETLNVDVQLTPDGQDGLVVLLVSLENTGTTFKT